jgi:enolase
MVGAFRCTILFQEFMIFLTGDFFFSCNANGFEVLQFEKKGLHDRGLSTAVGDEGGFAPNLAE